MMIILSSRHFLFKGTALFSPGLTPTLEISNHIGYILQKFSLAAIFIFQKTNSNFLT